MYEFDNIFVFIGNNDLVQPGKLYTLKIYEDDELIRNYIPCKDSIGRVCLYEEVSGQFVYAQGGEDFVGPEE